MCQSRNDMASKIRFYSNTSLRNRTTHPNASHDRTTGGIFSKFLRNRADEIDLGETCLSDL
jgi:hypothetical protein